MEPNHEPTRNQDDHAARGALAVLRPPPLAAHGPNAIHEVEPGFANRLASWSTVGFGTDRSGTAYGALDWPWLAFASIGGDWEGEAD